MPVNLGKENAYNRLPNATPPAAGSAGGACQRAPGKALSCILNALPKVKEYEALIVQ